MTRINLLQNKIIELEGGAFQGLCDAYLYKKYQLKNIHSLGAQEGTNKTTIGVPDSYVHHEDGTYTFIMYGHQKSYKSKIEKDIKDCLNSNVKKVPYGDIKRIIICHTSTNITTIEDKKFRELGGAVKIDLIGLDTIVQDLSTPTYQGIAKDFLNIKIDSGQIFSIDDFVKSYDKGGMSAPLDIEFKFRENDFTELVNQIKKNDSVLVSGASGVGKTRLVLEVCRRFESEGYQVFCVKSNGQSLYDDFTMSASESGRFLFFLDDINVTTDVRAIIGFIQSSSDLKEIKLVATVRDYEKGKISGLLNEFTYYHEKRILNLSVEEVRTILEECLEIRNKDYQDRIVKISKGNIRLAIFAGKSAIEDINSVNNPTGIFKAYYGKIFEERFVELNYVKVLFIISLLGTVKINETNFATKLLEEFGIDWKEFREIGLLFHQNELVDFYLEEVIKVNDQSFKDYILEYSLIEKKIIRISRLLEIGLVKNRKQVVSAINTLVNIFPSEQTQEYVSKEILSQWSVATENEQDLYLESFYPLNPVKSLTILKEKIDGFSKVNFEISDEYFNSKSNYNTINSKEISILSGFKNTDYFQEAIELLVELLKKHPDWFMDIYFSFINFIYDKYSHDFDYDKEYLLLETLWSKRKTNDKNFDFLLFKVVDKLLSCSSNITEEGDSPNSIRVGQISILLTDGSKRLRALCWQILSELYKERKCQRKVHEILAGNHWSGFDDYIIPIFEYDMQEVKKFFIDSWEEFTFEQCLILNRLVKFAENFKVDIDESFKKYEDNRDYGYYKVIASNARFENFPKNNEKRIEQIKNESKDYTLEDYEKLFSVAKIIEQQNEFIETYSVGKNLSILVRNGDNEILPDILELYFSFDAPFSGSLSGIIIDLLNSQGFDETFNFISQFDFPNKNIWINTMWTCLPKEMVSENQIALLIEHIKSEGKKQNPCIPRYYDLLKFLSVDKLIVQKVSELIATISESNQNIAHSFLLEFYNRPKELVELFSKNIVILEKMYFSLQFDYQGIILTEIIKLDPAFWKVYTKQVDMSSFHNNYDKEIFKQIWLLDNYSELMDVAYENIVALSYGFYFNFGGHETIFPVDIGQDSIRNDHIKTWVLNFISKYSDNFEAILNIFFVFVCHQNDEDKIKYIDKFLSYNKSYNDFMKLSLNPSSRTWSGSYVPIIEREIKFWEKLLAQTFLKGIEFIEHKNGISGIINFLENKKKETLLREYQDDYLNP